LFCCNEFWLEKTLKNKNLRIRRGQKEKKEVEEAKNN